MKFRVRILQTVIEEAWVTIEATDANEAENKAVGYVNENDAGWSFVECMGDLDVVSCEPMLEASK